MYGKIVLLLICFKSYFLFAQPVFEFPIQLKPDLSGAFGDLRKNHFHTGLDIRTGGSIGVPVYAAADGWMYRIKVSPYGFGNALYIQHEKGYISAYAHLDRFIPELEDSVLNRQKLTQLNSADWYLPTKAFPVKKGQLIAWSGNSGSSGGPHLHFEIREDEEHILNPLQFYKNYFQDNFKPIPEKISFIPINPGATIQEKPERKEFTPLASGNGRYRIADTVFVQGEIGLEYVVVDRLRAESFKINTPFVEFQLDESVVFELKLTKFGFSDKRYVNKHLDYSNYQSAGSLIQKCYLTDGNNFECYQSETNSGRIHLLDTKAHSWKIIFKDYHGNSSEVTGWIKNKNPKFNISLPQISPVKPKIKIEKHDHQVWIKIQQADKQTLDGLRVIRNNGQSEYLTPVYWHNQTVWFLLSVTPPFPIEVKNNSGSISEKFNYQTLIFPDSLQSFTYNGLKLVFSPGVNPDTFALELTSEPLQWNTWSPLYSIGRKNHPLLRPVEIGLEASRPVPESTKIFVAKVEGNTRVWLEGQQRDGSYYFARSIDFGKFCLAYDPVAPVASIVQYKVGANLSFSASDNGGSGLDEDKSAVWINEEWVPAVWQPKSNSFKVLAKFIPSGNKRIKIILRDRVGNTSIKSFELN